MTPTRRSLGLGRAAARAGLLALLVVSCLPSGVAGASTPQARGYWWRLQTGVGPPLPPPSTVPSGGLWVAGDGGGQHAISALRYVGTTNEEIQTLVLRVGASSGPQPVLLACAVGSAWQPAEAGAWAKRPEPACDAGFVNGALSGDGATWSFDVRGLARSGTLDVAVLSPPDLRTVFSVSFAAPGPDTIVTRRVIGSPSPSASPSSSGSPPGSPSPKTSVLAFSTKLATPSASPKEPDPSLSDSPSTEPRAAGPVSGRGGTRTGWLVLAAVLVALVTGWELRVARARG